MPFLLHRSGEFPLFLDSSISSLLSLYILEMVALQMFYTLVLDFEYRSSENEFTHEKSNPE